MVFVIIPPYDARAIMKASMTTRKHYNEATDLRTWIEVDATAIRRNVQIFRRMIPAKCRLMAVVKSNAYGHDLVPFAREAVRCGADALAVDSITEAITLRKEGMNVPILILGHILPHRIGEAINHNVSITAPDNATIETAIKAGKRAGVLPSLHIKVDTGMGRQGFVPGDLPALLALLKKNSTSMRVDGLYTHFAEAKNPAFPASTKKQLALFEVWRSAFADAGFTPTLHAAATGGTLLYPEAHFDMVRIGIGLYGIWPSYEVRAACEGRFNLTPVLSWKTRIGEIKKLPQGSTVGYDCTERLARNTTIAVIPVGYWHGYPRLLSSIGQVLIGGTRCRILGRVSMDMIVADITDLPKSARIGQEVVLLGTQGAHTITADELALLAQTSPYEIVTRLNPLMARIIRKQVSKQKTIIEVGLH